MVICCSDGSKMVALSAVKDSHVCIGACILYIKPQRQIWLLYCSYSVGTLILVVNIDSAMLDSFHIDHFEQMPDFK